jgi:hypothetical protein
VLCGLSTEIALTLQTMGLEMPDVHTVPSLTDALLMLGIGPLRRAEDDDAYAYDDEDEYETEELADEERSLSAYP